MRTSLVAAVALSAAVLAAGCKDEPKPTPASPSNSSNPSAAPSTAAAATQSAGAAMGNMADKAGAAASDMKDKAAGAASDAKEKAGEMKDKAADKGAEAKDAATAKVGEAEQKAGATGGGEGEAAKLYAQVQQHLSEGKLDMADKAFQQLDKLKPSLSSDWQTKIDQLKPMVEKAKGLGSKLPSTLPSLPGGIPKL
jgi:hypothetical protein